MLRRRILNSPASCGIRIDTAGHMDSMTADGGNTGLVERRSYISESRVVEMMGRLHINLFLQYIFVLNGVSVKIRLARSKDAFSLMAGGQNPDYKVPIVDAVLFARKAVLSPTVQMAHIKALEKGQPSIRYDRSTARSTPFHKVQFLTHTRTCSSGRCRNDSSCGASTTTPTTANTLKTHSKSRTTPLTSWPSTSTDVRFRPNGSTHT